MRLTIQRFTLIVILILSTVLISLFSYSYISQQEKTATVILKSIHSSIGETSYILSKEIIDKKSVKFTRPLLDRISAHNDFIAAVIIHDENTILLSTDPFYKTIAKAHQLDETIDESAYTHLISATALESDIYFYSSSKKVILKLQFILDKDEINSYFTQKRLFYILYFIIIPLVMIMIIWLVMKSLIVTPLERLRQFAYYQNDVPKVFFLQELEIIRYSMVQTFQRLETEKKELYSMARTDSLSGLANRNALNEYLEILIQDSKRNNKEFAFLFLDIDHFKSINDSLGHNVGDELLKEISSKINDVIRPKDFVARVGGDEFIIILQEYNSVMDLTNVIQRILDYLSKPWLVQTNPISITSSIGIAFYPKDGEDIVTLMKHSDIAMYEAKQTGRARYHFFTEELNQSVQNTIRLNLEMKQALIDNEYELYYQAKVDVKSSKIIGAEALIRWISPQKGLIPPNTFIPLAEENNFILKLGAWVLDEAISQQAEFKKQNIDIPISINISAKQILEDGFSIKLINTLEKYEVSPKDIDIEITEYMFLQQTDNSSNVLKELHELGVSISLDDFGTGYSSLSYLKEFHIDYLKIDKSFMDDYNTEKGAIFLETIVKMGQTLNMKIIAEGIEEENQLKYLHRIECDQYQGYYFSKPLPVKDFKKLYLDSISKE